MTYTPLARVARSAFPTLFSFLILLVVLTDGRSSIVSSATAQGETSTPPSVTVSLRSFGAVGDGLNDDAPALQRALDSLAQSALGGDATLVVPAGRYALMTPVAKNFENRINSLNIIGEIPFDVPESEGPGRGLGLSSEFIVRLGDADALSISSLSNVHIRDVVFIGDLAVSNDARIVLGLSEIGNATVRHCEFYGLASLTANGALIYAHHSRLNLEDSAFLGCTANAGFNTSVVQNTLWRGITVSNTRFIDYGNRPDYFSKTPYAVPLSWISIGNAAAHDEESAWREAIIRDVFLDEGGYIGLTCRPDLFAPYIPGGGPIDLVHISGLRMNVSNLDAHGLQLAHANRLMIERSFFGWSQNADTAITMSDIGEAIIDQSECAVDATTIRAEASVGRLDVVNSIYQTLDSLAQVTNVVNTTPDADPVQHVRQQFLALVAREADPAAFFYWSNQILRCGNAAQCVADKKLALNNYLNTHPSATFDISGRVTGDDDAGLPGVTMTLTGSAASTAVTDNEGRYRFARLPTSGVYTVTPSKTYYTFNAPSQTLTTPNGQRVADFRGAINRYSINGQVTTQSGAPLAGATVALSGSRTASVVTGNDGTYRFDALPAGGTYTLTPSKVNRTFQSPATLTFQNLTANQTAQSFVAVTVNYQISGRVTTPGGTPLSGTRVDLTGTGTGAAFTDANGNYSFVVQAEGSYTLRPTRANYGFTPAFLSFNNLSKNETANFNALLNNYNISGTVTLNGSVPLSGVRMVLSGGQTGEMFTGDDGSYFFTVKADGTYTVKPSLDGHSFRSATTGLSSETISGINRHHAVNFIGKSSHIISGKITTAGGGAVGGVSVSLSGTQSAAAATTDADGNYSIVARAMGNYTVTPSKTNYDFTSQTLSFNQLEADQTANFTGAKNRHSIAGRIANASGAALANATVTLSGAQNKTATTNADGRYSFDELQPVGTYVVAVSKNNYSFNIANRTFNGLNTDQTADFTGALVSYTIGGRITTSDGARLGGVAIILSGSQSGSTMTDADGNYSFTVTAEGNYTLTPSKSHFTFNSPSLSFNNLSAHQSADFLATLNRHSISGRVTNTDGNPIAGVLLTLSGAQSSTATTDASGNYSFASLPAGNNYTVMARRANYTFNVESRTVNELGVNESVDFVGTLVDYSISGRITADDGTALSGVAVSLTGSETGTATTDADGNYSFTVTAEGDYTVSPSKKHYTFTVSGQTFSNLSAKQSANFTATLNRHTISGRITRSDGAGFAGVAVALTGARTATATTDAQGNYTFANLPAGGSYIITPTKSNYAFNQQTKTFDDLSANAVADFAGVLVSYSIGGRITADDGTALSGVAVSLTGSETGTATTDADGNYSFTVTAEGNYTLTPSKSHFTFNSPSLSFNNLSAHQSADFLATLNRHSISGRVTNTDGNPIAGVLLTLSGAQSSTATTDASGNYSFASLPAGNNYTVMARRANYTFNVESRTVNELGVNESVDFVGTLVDYSISGRVVRDDGLALDGVAVTLTGSANGTATTDADGRYSFKVKAEGSYTLMASRANHTFAPANRSFNLISADQTADFLGALNTYNINGIISDGLHKPLGGVRVVLSGDHAGETLTNEAGVFSFNVKAEGSYTLTPSKTNYTFSPTAQTFARLGEDKPANFSGNLIQLLQFGEAVYSVSEGAGTVQFNVVRIGETSGAAQVNYATLSGTASDRSDYSAAFGTLQFAPGEASKTVNIFITDDAYLENAETFSVALSNLTGATFGAASTATVTIGNNDAADAPNPVKWDAGFNSEFFVRQHYIDFFNREADSDGLSFWRGQINGCGANVACAESRRANVSAAFFVSIENHETGYLVYRFHHAAYGRRIAGTVPLTFREFLTDVKQIGRGVVVNVGNWKEQLAQNKQAYADAFVNRTEFLALYPLTMSAEAFVDALNANTGASLSQAERDALVGRLQANQTTRAQALMEVAEDAEFQRRESNRAFVLMQYFGYLRRNPDDAPDGNMAGFNFWLQKLNNHNGNYISAEMVKAFLTSPEYIGRFGQ